MNETKPLLGVWGTVLLIAAALAFPQLQGARNAQARPDGAELHGQAALGYAKVRLWRDFLDARRLRFATRALPHPSLAEYRSYLKGLGLERRGDRATLLVLPALAAGCGLDRIQVTLTEAVGPLRLSVALCPESERTTTVGAIILTDDERAGLVCAAVPARAQKLWSFWPRMSQPLLP